MKILVPRPTQLMDIQHIGLVRARIIIEKLPDLVINLHGTIDTFSKEWGEEQCTIKQWTCVSGTSK